MARDLSGAAVLVTGAASGIGRAGALAFARAGARVAAVDVDARGLATLAEESDGRIRPMVGDVRDADQVENAVANTVAAFGRLDIAHNNAGVPGPFVPLWEYSEEDFAAVLSVDLLGVWRCLKFEARQMIGQGGGGHIVNTSSMLVTAGVAGTAAEAAARQGVHGLTRAAALELAPYGVRVNAVAPGVTRTGLITDERGLEAPDVPLGRIAEPEEIADAVLWLACAAYATGAVLNVDGGCTAR
ncbi:SDR family NAD(P)-dependent oxidoreductase [Pseudonocardia cypriaca]|uniref:NAD(P)-dependent dehydrogenase (Short-subunit alcohol dehydrogenase family) n=1 Tax=Pseudonocardia cypriaca TaxID=882449 RepID=A0A543FRL8_9PSEU|nr:SDR family oxidoreductase [Pseudonocardia cypriaca]TQM36487.1 NAD(P)-dependent dehydrogenase (short-subunit alcohol dehydrogenase family) [Pseudonocardia cypriaca]